MHKGLNVTAMEHSMMVEYIRGKAGLVRHLILVSHCTLEIIFNISGMLYVVTALLTSVFRLFTVMNG